MATEGVGGVLGEWLMIQQFSPLNESWHRKSEYIGTNYLKSDSLNSPLWLLLTVFWHKACALTTYLTTGMRYGNKTLTVHSFSYI